MRPVVSLARGTMAVMLMFAFASAPSFAQSINTNYVPGTDFSRLKTYKWVAVDGQAAVDQITDGQIKAAVDKQLAAKGMTKSDSDKADAFVAYQVDMQQEKELNAFGSPGWRFGGGMASVTTSTVDVGTLVIDIYDPAGKTLLWRGSATESVGSMKTPDKKQGKLDKAMEKLFKKFPPQPK